MARITDIKLIYETQNVEYKTGNSRYQILRVINDNTSNRYLETQNQKTVPESNQDSYHVVQHDEVGRLDIISTRYYGTPIYWWAIALANEFIDPFIVNEGVMIRIPSLMTLSDSRSEILTRR